MTTPDLVSQAYKKQKLQPENLGHAQAPISTFKILSSHLLDFVVIYLATSACFKLLQASFEEMMMTKTLRKAWLFADHRPEFFVTFAIIMVGYFFFSYFFDNGQTVGMKYTKTRYVLRQHSFSEALRATLFSVGLYFTGGMALKSLKSSIASHDYLYQELVIWREGPSMKLETFTSDSKWTEENFEQAA